MMDLAKMTIDDLNCAIQDCLDTIPNVAGMELSGMRVLKSSQQYQDEALHYQREIDRRRKPRTMEEQTVARITEGTILPPLKSILAYLERSRKGLEELNHHGHFAEDGDLLALRASANVDEADAMIAEWNRRASLDVPYGLS